MKYLYLFILIMGLLINPFISEAQNHLSNAGFENGSYDYSVHYAINFDENLNDWQGNFPGHDDNEGFSWHSPDWFVGQPWHYPASPHEGNAYIGMADYEIAEQKLTGNNKLEEDYHYLVKLYIYIHNTDVDGSPHPNPTNSVLNIYLAKNKI